MNLTKLALKRPVSVVLLVIMIVFFGVNAFTGMEQELTPEMESPMMLVMTQYAGANPEDVEDLVTSELEDAVSTLSDVKSITTMSQEGSSIVLLQYQYGTDMDNAYDELKKKLDSTARVLPDSANDPQILEMGMNEEDTVRLAVTGEVSGGLYNYVEQHITPELEKLSGVASVSTYGGQKEYVSVGLNRELMEQYGLSMTDVVNAIASADFSLPVGDAQVGKLSLSVTTGMTYNTMESLTEIPIVLNNGNIILLKDIATVSEAKEEQSQISTYDGEENMNIGIVKQQSATAQQVSKGVNQLVSQWQSEDNGLSITISSDSYTSIKSSLDSVATTILMAVVISMIILFLFFGDWKASLIIGSAMPVSVLVAIILMKWSGLTINIITMASLVIGVGMIVDNSIVVLESCFRSREEGNGLQEAAYEGTKRVCASIVASTITSVVVYVPLISISGMAGQLFQPLGFVIVFALIASLLAAMTIVPLAYYKYQPVEKANAPLSKALKKLTAWYERFLRKSIYKKKTVFLVTVLLLAVSLVSLTQVEMELMPAGDEGTIAVDVTTRPGIMLEEQRSILSEVEAYIVANENMEHYSLQGTSFTVELKSDRTQSTQEIIGQWKVDMRQILNCDIEISNSSAMSSMSMASDALQFVLKGADYEHLKSTAAGIVKELNSRADVTMATSSLANAEPVIKIEIDPIKATAEGFTPAQVANTVSEYMSGKQATTIVKDGEELDVTVEFEGNPYQTVEAIQSITLTGMAGQSVPLADMAELVYKDSPQTIQKEDGYYNVTISVEVKPENMSQSKMAINQMMNTMNLPDGISFGVNSIQEMMNEEFSDIYSAILYAVFLVFMVMAMQFESPRFSFMVMMCIPFSLVGSFLVLFVTGTSLSMTSLMGFLMLIGCVVNNGILYVDTVNEYKMTMSLEDSLVQAGVDRLRPILMTSMTTSLGLSPLALGIGENSEMMQGFAVVAIGGLLASTVLALLLLPTFYMVMNKKDKKNKKKKEVAVQPELQP